MKATSIVVLAAFAVGATALAQSPQRPGLWEVAIQMQMANVPVQMPEMKTTQCITAEDLKDPMNAVPNSQGRGRGRGTKADCKMSDYKASGNTVTWQMACSAPPSTSSGEMTFSGDSYTGAMKMSTAQGDMTMKMAGKRLGDCTR